MDKSPSVDREVSIRKLGEESFGLGMFHARSDGDVHRGVSVSVCLIPTVRASKDRPIPYAFVPASGAYMRRVSWVNCDHEYAILPSHRFECHSEFVVGHSFGFAVAFPITSRFVQMFEVFNRDEGVVAFSEFNDFMGDLPAACSRVVAFVSSKSSKCLFGVPTALIGIAFELASSKADVALTVSHIFTQIQLLQHLSLAVNDGYCRQSLGAYIDTNYSIIVFSDRIVFLEDYVDSSAVELKEGRLVALTQQFLESPICTVHGDGNGDSSVQCSETDYGVTVLCRSKVPASRNIVWYRNVAPHPPPIIQNGYSVLEEVAGNLAVETIFPNSSIEKALEFHSACFDVLRDHERESFSIGVSKIVYCLLLNPRGFQKIQGYSFNDFHPKTKCSWISIIFKGSPIPPTTKVRGLPWRR